MIFLLLEFEEYKILMMTFHPLESRLSAKPLLMIQTETSHPHELEDEETLMTSHPQGPKRGTLHLQGREEGMIPIMTCHLQDPKEVIEQMMGPTEVQKAIIGETKGIMKALVLGVIIEETIPHLLEINLVSLKMKWVEMPRLFTVIEVLDKSVTWKPKPTQK